MASTTTTSLITDSSKKHNIRTGIYYSVYHKTIYMKDNTVSFAFSAGGIDSVWIDPPQTWEDSGQGFWWHKCNPGTVTATGGITPQVTPSSKGNVSAFFSHYNPSEGDYDSVLQNFTARVVYSETKATPAGTCSYLGGYLDATQDNQITFGTTKQNIDTQYTVTRGTFYYKEKSASNYSSIAFTGNACTIPAGSLTKSKYYDAYAALTCDDNTSCTLTLPDLNTNDTIGTATAVSPVNTVIYGESDFLWNYSTETGAAQYAYDLQVSYDEGSTWTEKESHVVTAETTAHVTGINAGNVVWRVRSYNQDDIASDWSNTLEFISNAAPTPPVIGNISGNGRITVGWSAADQVAYQVIVQEANAEVYNSGIVYSTQKNHFVNYYLPNGDYQIGVRVFNGFGKASNYTTAEFQQVTELSGLEAGATADPGDQGVIITAEMPGAVTYYLLRNEITVAQFDGRITDHFSNGRTHYAVIAVDANDRFARADFEFEYIVKTNRLVLKNGTIISIDQRWNDPFVTSQSTDAKYYAAEYLGASVPEHIFAKMRTKRIQVAFNDTGEAEALLGKTVFFADTYGNGIWCVPVGITRSDAWFGNETVMNLEMTDGGEGIDYAY